MGFRLAQFVGSVATAYIVALAVWPLLKRGAKLIRVGTGLAVVGISASPALVDSQNVLGRAFSCLLCIDLLFRVVDYARQRQRGTIDPITWRDYWTFLIPFPFLLTVYGRKQQAIHEPHSSRADQVRLIACLSGFLAVLLLCIQSQSIPALRASFFIDHLLKLILFTVAVETASQVQVILERFSGFCTVPIIQHSYRSRTPAEFWFRYNQRVRDWLYLNVFVPCGGRRAPAAGVIAVFLVSAIFHEVAFALASSRLDGYQFTFFMLQAPAVILSRRLERLARRGNGGRLAAHALTWLWFAVTSPLFFHGLDRVFPFFYASEPWLP